MRVLSSSVSPNAYFPFLLPSFIPIPSPSFFCIIRDSEVVACYQREFERLWREKRVIH